MTFDLLLAAGDLATSDPVTVIAGILATLMTGLTGVQTAQMSGLRHDFQTYRTTQEQRMEQLEGRVNELEDRGIEVAVPARRKATGSHTTTKGRRPKAKPEA